MRVSSLALLLSIAPVLAATAGGLGETEMAARIEAARTDPLMLRALLKEMPKGADLHSHLAGAAWAESYIAWAAGDGLCVDVTKLALVPPPCDGKDRIPAAAADKVDPHRSALIKSLSAASYLNDGNNAHDQFFGAFGRFGSVSRSHAADQLAEVMARAANQNVIHLELMYTFNGGWAWGIGPELWSEDWDAVRRAMGGQGEAEAVAAARTAIESVEADARRSLGCGGPAADPGCGVSVRWLQQINRGAPPYTVFAQMLLAFDLAATDPRVVGINMVGAEDGRQAIDDYDLHMRMIGYFSRLYPQVAIALHAGELVLGLVPPAELRDHIRKAIDLTPVRRIGHGVDVMYEDDPFGLLAEMARRKVMVEINLTSNDLILSVRGRDHPLGTYLRAGVPAALSTDDEGIERIDLTHEYQIAVEEHGLSYRDLKRMSRNALEYSFLPGPSLWAEPDRAVAVCRPLTAPACATWAAASPKAQAQLRLEQRFTAFETRPWPPIAHRTRR